jgi:hypothetical protein
MSFSGSGDIAYYFLREKDSFLGAVVSSTAQKPKAPSKMTNVIFFIFYVTFSTLPDSYILITNFALRHRERDKKKRLPRKREKENGWIAARDRSINTDIS